MNQNSSVRKLARCAVVAAIYVVLCMALQPFSYGAVQVRVAEALCLLPVFGPEYIAGVVLGCFLANLLGSTIVDVIFGTLATLLACLVTYKLRDLRFKGLALAASLPPVLFNAVIIGIEIAVLFPDPSSSYMRMDHALSRSYLTYSLIIKVPYRVMHMLLTGNWSRMLILIL